MKKWYVYELINFMGSVEYVGRTKNPKGRFIEHFKTKPTPKNKHGLFYGRQDMIMNIVKDFDNVKDANLYEGELKLSHGLPWTEKEGNRRGGLMHVESGHIHIARKKAYTKTSKVVVVYNEDGSFVGEYKSESECGRVLGLSQQGVNNICKGIRKSVKGYIIKKK